MKALLGWNPMQHAAVYTHVTNDDSYMIVIWSVNRPLGGREYIGEAFVNGGSITMHSSDKRTRLLRTLFRAVNDERARRAEENK